MIRSNTASAFPPGLTVAQTAAVIVEALRSDGLSGWEGRAKLTMTLALKYLEDMK